MSNEVLYCECRQNGDIGEWLTECAGCPLNNIFQITCTKSIYFITFNHLQSSVLYSLVALRFYLFEYFIRHSRSAPIFLMLQHFQMKCKCTMWRYAMHKTWLNVTFELWFDLTFLHLNSKVILSFDEKWKQIRRKSHKANEPATLNKMSSQEIMISNLMLPTKWQISITNRSSHMDDAECCTWDHFCLFILYIFYFFNKTMLI